MTKIKAFAHQLLGTAVDNNDLTIEEIASTCNMDEQTTKRIIKYLKENNYIENIQYHSQGDSYPVKFEITAAGYDWLDEMDRQNGK